jgi:hypothetical protein
MKRKVNINRQKVSSDEINQRKNFDSVLKNSPGIGAKPLLKKPWFLSSLVVATVAIVATIVFLNKDSQLKSPDSINGQAFIDTDSLELAQFYKAEEAKPCIAPPISGLNIPYTIFKVNAEKGGEFAFKTGSKLTVPQNAFTDENGKSLKGEVELHYREFHDPADFFVSGIPMTYDSAGVKYQFESAGMMEMLAFQNGKAVNMAPGKTINVELASNYKGTEYNLYKLDTLKNNWSCLGKDKVESNGNQKFNTQTSKDYADKKFEETPEYKQVEIKKEEAKVIKESQIAVLPKPLPEPKKPQKSEKGKYTFNIDVDAKDYPELAVYKGLLFEVGNENKNFSNSMYDITWDEATIKEGTRKGENYQLTLVSGKKKYDLIVYPVFEGKNYESAIKEYQDKFTKYNVTLEKRKTEEKRIEDEYTAKLIRLKNEQAALELKWKKEMDAQLASMTTEEKIRRVFQISSLGVFNCDNPSVYPKGASCVATLTNDKKAKLLCYDIYLVDKQKNGLFTFYKNPVTTFSFNPKSTNMLWTVENGVLYYLKPEQFIDLKNGTENIQMSRVEQKFESVDEMKKFFNL